MFFLEKFHEITQISRFRYKCAIFTVSQQLFHWNYACMYSVRNSNYIYCYHLIECSMICLFPIAYLICNMLSTVWCLNNSRSELFNLRFGRVKTFPVWFMKGGDVLVREGDKLLWIQQKCEKLIRSTKHLKRSQQFGYFN